MTSKKYTCPVCGWNELSAKPYENMPENPHPVTIEADYESFWGMGSAEVCGCCGFEFGNDDNSEFAGYTFQSYLEKWVAKGAKWFDPNLKPLNWDLATQLQQAGINVPSYVTKARDV